VSAIRRSIRCRDRPVLAYFVEKLGDYLPVFGLIKRGLTRSAWRLAAVNRFAIISFCSGTRFVSYVGANAGSGGGGCQDFAMRLRF